MINYLVFIYLIFDQLYVILASILRLDSTSTQDLSAYVYLKVFLAVFSSGIIIMKILLDKKISLKTLYSLIFVSLFILFLLLTNLRYESQLFTKSSLVSLSYLAPFLILISFISLKKIVFLINKYFKYIVFSISIISVFDLILTKVSTTGVKSLYGVTYQTSTYIFAINLLIILYYILNSKNKVWTINCYVLYVINLVSLFMCGGKGGTVAFIVGTIGLIIKFPNKNAIRFVILFLVSLSFFSSLIISNYNFQLGFERAFSFIDIHTKTIVWENSSDRDILFSQALQTFFEKPIFGWGIGSSYFTPLGIYPHNFFLEILIDGGVFYLLLWLVLIFYGLTHFSKFEGGVILKILIFVNIIMLMFSGSYLLGNYAFWLFMYYTIENMLSRSKSNGNKKKNRIFY